MTNNNVHDDSMSFVPSPTRKAAADVLKSDANRLLPRTSKSRLIHVPSDAKRIDIVYPSSQELLEDLADGKSLVMIESTGQPDQDVRRNEILCERGRARGSAKSGWLTLVAQSLSRELLYLQRDKGVWAGALVLEWLTWNEAPSTAEEHWLQSPLITLDVKLDRVGNSWSMQVTGDSEPALNAALALRLQEDYGAQLPIFKSGVDIAAFTTQVRKRLISKGVQTREAAMFPAFTRLTFPEEAIFNDYKTNASKLVESSAYRLVREGESARDAESPLRSLDPSNMAFDTDESQHAAVELAVNGKSLVVHGPPGTGKSQTIAATISELMSAGKTVLFVAEKRAAVEAVVKRLATKGLDKFVTDLHSSTLTSGPVFKMWAHGLEKTGGFYSSSRQARTPATDRARESADMLQQYFSLMNLESQLGYSTLELLSQYEFYSDIVGGNSGASNVPNPFELGHDGWRKLQRTIRDVSVELADFYVMLEESELWGIVGSVASDSHVKQVDRLARIRNGVKHSSEGLTEAWSLLSLDNGLQSWFDTYAEDLSAIIEHTPFWIYSLETLVLAREAGLETEFLAHQRNPLGFEAEATGAFMCLGALADARDSQLRSSENLTEYEASRAHSIFTDCTDQAILTAYERYSERREESPILPNVELWSGSKLNETLTSIATLIQDISLLERRIRSCFEVDESSRLLSSDTTQLADYLAGLLAHLRSNRPGLYFEKGLLKPIVSAHNDLTEALSLEQAAPLAILGSVYDLAALRSNPSQLAESIKSLLKRTKTGRKLWRVNVRLRLASKGLKPYLLQGKLTSAAMSLLNEAIEEAEHANAVVAAAKRLEAALWPMSDSILNQNGHAWGLSTETTAELVELYEFAGLAERLGVGGTKLGSKLTINDALELSESSRRIAEFVTCHQEFVDGLELPTKVSVSSLLPHFESIQLDLRDLSSTVKPADAKTIDGEVRSALAAEAYWKLDDAFRRATSALRKFTTLSVSNPFEIDSAALRDIVSASTRLADRLSVETDADLVRASAGISHATLASSLAAVHEASSRQKAALDIFVGYLELAGTDPYQAVSFAIDLPEGLDDLRAALVRAHRGSAGIQRLVAIAPELATGLSDLRIELVRQSATLGGSTQMGKFVEAYLVSGCLRRAWESLVSENSDIAAVLEDGERLGEFLEVFRRNDADSVYEACNSLEQRLSHSRQQKWNALKSKSPQAAELRVFLGKYRHRHQNSKTRLREFLQKPFAIELVQTLTPCVVASPTTVSQYLPVRGRFDYVIFDEASQIIPIDSLGALGRAESVVIAGDQQQLPPTSFFGANESGASEFEEEITSGLVSLLDLAVLRSGQGHLEGCHLKWHYRSKHESLIRFSIERFYSHSDMVWFPSVASASSGTTGLTFDYVNDGRYADGVNTRTAMRSVETALTHLKQRRSVGIVTFGSSQAEEIHRLIEQDPVIRESFANLAKIGIDIDDAESYFFVKSIESVQGDERDVVILDFNFGYNEEGKFRQNFGPMSSTGADKRLNVAITRAREQMVVVSSVRAVDFPDNERKTGADNMKGSALLRDFMAFAENPPSPARLPEISGPGTDSPFEDQVIESARRILRDLGRAEHYEIHTQVGCEGYRIDFAIYHLPSETYVLGVECDGAQYHSSRHARSRDRIRHDILTGMGWDLYHIWGGAWFGSRDKAVGMLIKEMARVTGASATAL